jgi:dihydroorotate dehydrogenase (NAD+) catalytic subunit
VVGSRTEDFAAVVSTLAGSAPIAGFELNVSCPNVKAGGMEFGADTNALTELIRRSRSATKHALFVKLSPTLPKIADTARAAADAGADGITVVNTFPGLAIDVERRTPALGFGTGGLSGSALLPVGVLAAYRVSQAVALPVIGVGGISSATDALQYVMAGASLVAVGTAAMRDPRLATRIVSDLEKWCERHGVANISEVRGSLEWQ